MNIENDEKNENNPEDELKGLLGDAEKIASERASEGRERTQAGQGLADDARIMRELLDEHPNLIDYETQIPLWKGAILLAKRAGQGMSESNSLLSSANNTAGTASSNMVLSIHSAEQIFRDKDVLRIDDSISIKNFFVHMSRPEIKKEALEQLKLFGFEASPAGIKSPVEQFNLAHQAFEAPVSDDNPVITILLPIRTCNGLVVAELLKQRQYQEETGNNFSKVKSIGMQLRRDEIPDEVVESWAKQYDELLDLLSPGKDKDFSRDEIARRLQVATLFLKNFLTGLDPEKMKKNQQSVKHDK